MNNGNKNIGNSELIALANRRREQMKKAESERIPAPPPPKPQSQVQPQPQPKPQSKPQPQPDKKRERELQKKRAAAEKQRAAAEKQKREQEARVEKDKLAAKKRILRREKTEKVIGKLSSLRDTYKDTIKNAGAYFVLFLCVLLIICTLSATVFLLSLMNYGERPETPKTVSFTTEGKNKKYDYDEIVRGGIYYINFSEISKFCSFSQSGDSTTFIYSTASGEQLKFTPPSRLVLVNGNSVTANAEIICSDGELWVPADFISDYVSGIELIIDEGTDAESGKPYLKITLSRALEGETTAAVGFALKHNSVLSGISNESLPEEPVTLPADAPKYEYASDLSSYLKYMCPEDYDKHMILINPSNPVDETYIPEDLISVPNQRYDNGASLCRDASKSLEALFLEMHTLGFRDMKVGIAYRSYEQQKNQFDIYTYNERYYYRTNYEKTGKWFSDEAYKVLGKSYLETKYISIGKTSLSADDAKRVAMSYSAYPGTGDHQTGLALDLYLPSYTGTKFAESDEYKWLAENAHKFGFIFRYPEDKVNITGYSFEPVHLRFVGQYHAALIFETGLALEEYVSKYIN
ncbi:MAG: M15 family metallopeptidase [Clostridia bacterium]|nr:M15 family metallopeptidase [Clostridia bacterium]